MWNMFHTSNNIAWKILFYSNCELPVYKDQFIVLLHSHLFIYITLSWVASQVVLAVKNSPANAGRHKRCRFNPWVGKIPWRRKRQPIPVFLPGKFHRQRSLVGYSPWGHKELDMTEAT